MKLYSTKEWKCFCGDFYFRAENIANFMTCLNRECARFEKTICDGCESDVSKQYNHYC